MTDAEILRKIADESYMGATASGDAALVVLATDLPKGDIDEAIQKAATAIEENARLRSLLATLRDDLLDEANRRLGTAWGDAAGRRVALIDGTVWDADAFANGGADGLRASGAGGDDAK